MKNNKQRLLEVMERLNPEFRINEQQPQQTPVQAQSGDVANLEKAVNSS
jgi:hypothetical protein